MCRTRFQIHRSERLGNHHREPLLQVVLTINSLLSYLRESLLLALSQSRVGSSKGTPPLSFSRSSAANES